MSGLPTSGACLPASPSPVSSLIPHIREILHSRILCSLLSLPAPAPLLHCTALDSAHRGTAHHGIDRLTGLPVVFTELFFQCLFYFFDSTGALFRHGGSMYTLSCGMWDPVPQSGIELEPPALGVWSLSHWREFPIELF